MLSNYVVSVTSAPTLIVTGLGTNADPTRIYLANDTATTIYIGGDTVSTTNGFPIPTNSRFEMVLRAGEVLYGAVASGSADLRVLRTV